MSSVVSDNSMLEKVTVKDSELLQTFLSVIDHQISSEEISKTYNENEQITRSEANESEISLPNNGIEGNILPSELIINTEGESFNLT